MKARVLDRAYRNEHDGCVKERMLLVIRVSDDKQHIESAAQELHRSRAWAYKRYRRCNDEGIEGLRDRHRSGKPSVVSTDTKEKIRQELSDSNMGWDFRQVMDLIQKRTGVKYHEVHIRRLLHRWGFSPEVPQKRFVRTATKEEEKGFKKEYRTP